MLNVRSVIETIHIEWNNQVIYYLLNKCKNSAKDALRTELLRFIEVRRRR